MAQKLVTVDDIDGSSGAKALPFSVGKDTWEIDLTDENAQKLRDALAPFIAKARKQPRAKSARTSPLAPGESKAIRAWAGQNGHTVPARGRVPQDVIDAYHAQGRK